MDETTETTIADALNNYHNLLKETRASHTAKTYLNGLSAFLDTLSENGINPETACASELAEDAISWFASDLKYYAPATERLYLQAVFGFFEYLSSEGLSSPNLSRLRILIKHRSRRTGIRLPQFPRESIEKLLEYAINIAYTPVNNPVEKLINLRDRAFLLSLADTGLRVHEACELRRGDVDWNEGRAVVIGKGDREAMIRFSNRSLEALKYYLNARAQLDGGSKRPLGSLPVFSRHDKGAGNNIKPISTTTGRNIVKRRVKEALGSEFVGLITPHSLRHYFVTIVLQASGNLKLAQKLARHKNIAVTQRYAHLNDDELDRGYHQIFNED